MAGNGIFTAAGFGERQVVVTQVAHGVRFHATEGEARNHRSYYPTAQDIGAFALTVVFTNWAEYDDFGHWILGYTRFVSDPDRLPVAMRVRVPSRRFDQLGVIQRGISFGRKFDDVTWQMALGFVGVQDQLSYDNPLLAVFRAARNQNDTSKYFYPAGTQLDSADLVAAQIRDLLTSLNNTFNPNGAAPAAGGMSSRDQARYGA